MAFWVSGNLANRTEMNLGALFAFLQPAGVAPLKLQIFTGGLHLRLT